MQMTLLYSEHGATNILRKTALISKLRNLMYGSNQVKFKDSALTLILKVLKANITIQDILIQCLLNSLNGEKSQGFKLMIAKQLDDETDSSLYVVLTEICNCIEQSGGARLIPQRLATLIPTTHRLKVITSLATDAVDPTTSRIVVLPILM